jgi:uncharacterized NAD(P)/FAD-binding protein YdhS
MSSTSVDIAIIGGGFSGALVAAHLVEQGVAPLSIAWFDGVDANGLGIAYATDEVCHLLNVPADRMGAFPNRKDDFFQWLQSPMGKKTKESLCPGQDFTGDSFVPRQLYGQYLQSIVEDTRAKAAQKNIQLHSINGRINAAGAEGDPVVNIHLSWPERGQMHTLSAGSVVLATGNLPPRRFGFQTGMIGGRNGYVDNVWHTPADHIFPQRVCELTADDEAVIIGTGLTMVDTVLTLRARGYKGTITAISRHGLLPAAHAHMKPYPVWNWVQHPGTAPRQAIGLLIGLRNEIKRAEAEGYDWRSVIDSLRPVTQTLWRQMNMHERRRFLQRLMTLWNVHRHRMAPEIAAQLKSMQQSGSLKIVSGQIYYVGSDDDGLTVAYRRRGANRMETIRSPLVINCTGPTCDVATSDHQLLKSMRDQELITVGPLRAGIEINSDGSAKGHAAGAIWPIGSLLIGELLECTAVPELRTQAQHVAERALARLRKRTSNSDNLLLRVV